MVLATAWAFLDFLIADDYFHPRTHPAGDCHADLSGSCQQHYVFHTNSSFLWEPSLKIRIYLTHCASASFAPSTLLP